MSEVWRGVHLFFANTPRKNSLRHDVVSDAPPELGRIYKSRCGKVVKCDENSEKFSFNRDRECDQCRRVYIKRSRAIMTQFVDSRVSRLPDELLDWKQIVDDFWTEVYLIPQENRGGIIGSSRYTKDVNWDGIVTTLSKLPMPFRTN
jgi:hypothetical protein